MSYFTLAIFFGPDLTKSTPNCTASGRSSTLARAGLRLLILSNSDWQPSVGKWSLRTKPVGAYGVAGANAYLTIKKSITNAYAYQINDKYYWK